MGEAKSMSTCPVSASEAGDRASGGSADRDHCGDDDGDDGAGGLGDDVAYDDDR